MKYYVYAGYYENFISGHELPKPYVLRDEFETFEDAYDYLMDEWPDEGVFFTQDVVDANSDFYLFNDEDWEKWVLKEDDFDETLTSSRNAIKSSIQFDKNYREAERIETNEVYSELEITSSRKTIKSSSIRKGDLSEEELNKLWELEKIETKKHYEEMDDLDKKICRDRYGIKDWKGYVHFFCPDPKKLSDDYKFWGDTDIKLINKIRSSRKPIKSSRKIASAKYDSDTSNLRAMKIPEDLPMWIFEKYVDETNQHNKEWVWYYFLEAIKHNPWKSGFTGDSLYATDGNIDIVVGPQQARCRLYKVTPKSQSMTELPYATGGKKDNFYDWYIDKQYVDAFIKDVLHNYIWSRIKSSKKQIESKLNFDKITDMCDDLDFSTLGYGRDPQGDMIAELDAIEGESGNIEGVEIRFTENDDGQTVIAVYKKDHKVDTMTTKLVDGEISRDDINEAVYDFLEENSQMLNSSRKAIKSAKTESKETVSVDVNSLYHFLTDSETAEVEGDFALVRCDEDDGETYYDILSDGDLACMDGETCEIVGRGEGFVELHSIEANDGVNFKLSPEEFEVACGKSKKQIKSSLTSDSFEMMVKESRKMAEDMNSNLDDWWVTKQVGQDVVYFVAEHKDYSVRVRFEFVDSGFCYVSKTYTNGSYYEPVVLESWKYEGLSSQEIEGKMTAVLNDFFPKYNEIGSSKKPVESSVDYEPLTKLLDDLSAYPESRMPPAGIYKRLLDWKVGSEGMDETEARKKFGTFTVGEWIDDLKESVM